MAKTETSTASLAWRKYPKNRQKEFLSALKEISLINSKNNIKQEESVQAQWYAVLNYCFADFKENAPYSTHIDKLLQTDGLLFVRNIAVSLNLITEFKADVHLDHRTEQERILGQVIYYLKRIEKHIAEGNKLHLEMPNVVLAADSNQVFVINARVLSPYLKLDLGNSWNDLSPRKVYDTIQPSILFEKLHADRNINPYVYDINAKDFDLNDVIGLVADLAVADDETELTKISVNQANIRGVYDEFLRLVTQNKTKVASNQDLVSMFINALTDHESFFIRNNTATLKHNDGTYKDYRVNGRNWYAFFSRFDTNYNSDEIKAITAVGDVLLEETARRFSGEYWTPTIWAKEAINTISDVLGNNWKEDYVVWDPAAGSKNLTRDFKFAHLFSSTLFDAELKLGRMFNRNSVTFQYDFLNDDIDISPVNISKSKLAKLAPELAQALLDKKPIVFYTNPPYASAGDIRMDSVHHKKGVSKTAVNDVMKKHKIGHASENLYTQFFYRVLMIKKAFNLSDVTIAFFSKSQFMTGGKYFGKFKEKLFKDFEFKKGFLFNSGEFSDTSSDWGISFTVLQSPNNEVSTADKFPLEVKKDVPGYGIRSIKTHTIRNISKENFLSKWVRDATLKNKKIIWRESGSYPTFSSAFKIKLPSKSQRPPKYPVDAFGYAWNKANNVEKAFTETALFTSCYLDGHGFPVLKENFERIMLNFAIRKATKHTWINDKDNYEKPSDLLLNAQEYPSVLGDCVVYSLFNTYSYQVSLANVEYKGKVYDIKNQFFWLSKDYMKSLANKYSLASMGFDIDEDDERFVYQWLLKHKNVLSYEARKVINSSKLVIDDTFRLRNLLNEDYPEFCLTRWDAGWEQIRRIMTNSSKPDSYTNIFIPHYDKLEQKIRNYIYQYKFLEE